MSVRHLLVAAMLAALTAAPDAQAQLGTSFTVEGFGGYQNLRPNLSSATNAARGNEGTGILGADVLAGIGGFGVGAVVDKVVSGNNGQPWAGALMAGLLSRSASCASSSSASSAADQGPRATSTSSSSPVDGPSSASAPA